MHFECTYVIICFQQQVKPKASSPERSSEPNEKTLNKDNGNSTAIRAKRRRLLKDGESEGIDLCSK